MTSMLAAETTLRFYIEVGKIMPEYLSREPKFDTRVWQVPSKEEAANVFLWREHDATRNSIQMAGSFYYSHKELHRVSTYKIQEKLFLEKGINWNNYPAYFKRGEYIQRTLVNRTYTPEELDKLPAKHEARTNPDLIVSRNEVRSIELPIFSTIENRADVIFNGAEPRVAGAPVERFK